MALRPRRFTPDRSRSAGTRRDMVTICRARGRTSCRKAPTPNTVSDWPTFAARRTSAATHLVSDACADVV